MKSIVIALFLNALLISKVSAYSLQADPETVEMEDVLEEIGSEIIEDELNENVKEQEMIEKAETEFDKAQIYRDQLVAVHALDSQGDPAFVDLKDELLTNEFEAMENAVDMSVQAMDSAIRKELIESEISVLEDSNFSENEMIAVTQAIHVGDILTLLEYAAKLESMAGRYDATADLLDAELNNLKAEAAIDPLIDEEIHEIIKEDEEKASLLNKEAAEVIAVAEEIKTSMASEE